MSHRPHSTFSERSHSGQITEPPDAPDDFRGAWYHDADPDDPFVDDPSAIDREWVPCPTCECPSDCHSACRCSCHTSRRYH